MTHPQTTLKLPNFIVIGAMRGGTTFLHRLLSQHPQIFMPRKKELLYFTNVYSANGTIDLADYSARYFTEATDQPAIGEASPAYLYREWVPELLRTHLPDAKLILSLRNPTDRAYSHYWWSVSKGEEYLSFEAALAQEPARLATGVFRDRDIYSYTDRGYYMQQIARYLEYFPREQLNIILFDDLRAHTQTMLDDLCAFLEIDPMTVPPETFKNSGDTPTPERLYRGLTQVRKRIRRTSLPQQWRLINPIKRLQAQIPRTGQQPPMRPATRALLEARFAEPNQALFDFLERPNLWLPE
ncbi:MAG: sulfotransferase [Chloroflexi bacterium]|nr:sulfotransferase [Chloroflexota bacterium]